LGVRQQKNHALGLAERVRAEDNTDSGLWQRFGGEIDAFYAQLKTEVAHGWILEPAPAEMREKPADTVSA